MRAFLLLCLSLVCTHAFAKDVPLTALWSGSWSADADSSRCSIRISTRASLDLMCSFGPTAVRAEMAELAPSGMQVPLMRVDSELGAPPTGMSSWGQITMFAVCDQQGPMLYTSVERNSPADAFWMIFRPTSLDFEIAKGLCATKH